MKHHQRRAAYELIFVISGATQGVMAAIGYAAGAAAWGRHLLRKCGHRSDLMKIVFKIKEDDARNPGVIADCTGDNAATRWAKRRWV